MKRYYYSTEHPPELVLVTVDMGDPPKDNEGRQSDTEDCVSLRALSDDDLAYIASNPDYRAMLQDILSPIIGESSGKEASADHTGTSHTRRGTDHTRLDSALRRREEELPDEHSPSDEDSDEDAASEILLKLTHALGKRKKKKKSSPSSRKEQKLSDTDVEPRLFDPSLDREDKEEFKFSAPDVVGSYLEQHFRKGLAKEERTAMLKKHPKPDSKVMVPPKLDQFVSDFAPKKVDKARDASLSKIQGSLLYAVNPLANLWANLIEQDLTEDPQAVIPVSDVLDIIQRTLVLIGNANNLVSETRREVALDAIHSSLKKYAKGDFTGAKGDLFGEKFKEELVKKVEADTALSKAVRIVSRSSKIYQNPQKGKSSLFHDSRTSGYGAVFGKRYNPYPAHNNYQGKGKFTHGKNHFRKGSVFDRLGHKGETSRSPDQRN